MYRCVQGLSGGIYGWVFSGEHSYVLDHDVNVFLTVSLDEKILEATHELSRRDLGIYLWPA